MAYHDELAAIREGFADHDSGYAPKLVLVVASKRHTKKFFSTENAEQRVRKKSVKK
jgi:hypothetical protein